MSLYKRFRFSRDLGTVSTPDRKARLLIVAIVATNFVGTGMFLAGGAIYIATSRGFGPGLAGLAISVSGLLALSADVPLGMLADRWGALRLWKAALIVEAIGMAWLVTVQSLEVLIVALTVGTLGAAASHSAGLSAISWLGVQTGARLRAELRSVVNVATAAGALIASLILGTKANQDLLVLLNAGSFLACVPLVYRLEYYLSDNRAATRQNPGQASDLTLPRKRMGVLGDTRFIRFLANHTAFFMVGSILTFGIPLSLANNSALPAYAPGVVLALNMAIVAAFQVSIAKEVGSMPTAGRMARQAAVFCAAGLVGVGASTLLDVTVAAWLAVLLGIVLLTIGEMKAAGSEFWLLYALAPQKYIGEYAGLYGLAQRGANSLGPAIIGSVVVPLGFPGWSLLGAAIVLAGLIYPSTLRSVEKD